MKLLLLSALTLADTLTLRNVSMSDHALVCTAVATDCVRVPPNWQCGAVGVPWVCSSDRIWKNGFEK
jgi:hypothetical protein